MSWLSSLCMMLTIRNTHLPHSDSAAPLEPDVQRNHSTAELCTSLQDTDCARGVLSPKGHVCNLHALMKWLCPTRQQHPAASSSDLLTSLVIWSGWWRNLGSLFKTNSFCLSEKGEKCLRWTNSEQLSPSASVQALFRVG